MPFEKELEELTRRKQKALQMGGPEKMARREAEGRMNARQRIDMLLDSGSFMELGRLNHSDVPGMEEKSFSV